MAFEDYTGVGYVEVDPFGHLSRATNTVTITNMSKGEDAYVYKDFTVDYFGDFTHHHKVKITAQSGFALGSLWSLANLINDTFFIRNNDDLLNITATANGSTLRLYQSQSGTWTFDSFVYTLNVDYWLTLERLGTSCTCKIYSDSGRTTLLDTLSVTCGTTAFRYFYPASSWNVSSGTTMSAISADTDLDPGAVVGIAQKIAGIFGLGRLGLR